MVLQRHWTFSFSNNSRFVGRVLVSHYAFSQRYVQTLCDMLLKIARRKWECVTWERGVLPKMAFMGRLRPKGVSF